MLCRVVLAGLLASALSACAVIDSSVDPRYDTVNRSLAKLRNEAILLNIVRASHDYPLNFAAIGKVSPGMSNISGVALPNFLVGPNLRGAAPSLNPVTNVGRDVIFGNTTANNSLNINYNYDISTQETAEFYGGLLNPVTLSELNYFIRQGYSPELLFWLFTDSIEIGPPGHSIGFQFNPPYDYGCPKGDLKHRCFREWIELAVVFGLTTEQKTYRQVQSGKTLETVYSRFCFSEVLARRAQNAMGPERLHDLLAKYADRGARVSPTCGSTWEPGVKKKKDGEKGEKDAKGGGEKAEDETSSGELDTLGFRVGQYQFKIVTRSAYSIYQFLGKLLKQSREATEVVEEAAPSNVPDDELVPMLATVREDPYLFNVAKGSGTCFVHTYFIDGDYCIPEEAANTKRIFSILAQLIALKTKAGDLAITPTVRSLPAQ